MSDSQVSSGDIQTKTPLAGRLPWELIPGFFGALSGLSLFLSIIFDMGYFDTIGLRFSDVPTTISDHVRSALRWFPGAFTLTLFCVLSEHMQKHVGGLFTEAGLSLSKENGTYASTLVNWIFNFFIFVAYLVVILDTLSGGMFEWIAVHATIIIFLQILFMGLRYTAKKGQLSLTRLVLLYVSMVTFTVYLFGKAQAIEERAVPRKATITLEGQREVKLGVYRYLDRGILGTVGEGQLVFYRWEEVKRLDSAFLVPKRVNWLCQSFGFTCALTSSSSTRSASAASR
jgi:hypothetical protein